MMYFPAPINAKESVTKIIVSTIPSEETPINNLKMMKNGNTTSDSPD